MCHGRALTYLQISYSMPSVNSATNEIKRELVYRRSRNATENFYLPLFSFKIVERMQTECSNRLDVLGSRANSTVLVNAEIQALF